MEREGTNGGGDWARLTHTRITPAHLHNFRYRDGRDAMCSYYHFQTELGIVPTGTSFEDYLEMPKYPGWEHRRLYRCQHHHCR